MGENILKIKSFAFALKVIAAYKEIVKSHKEFVMSKQLLKAGTSMTENEFFNRAFRSGAKQITSPANKPDESITIG